MKKNNTTLTFIAALMINISALFLNIFSFMVTKSPLHMFMIGFTSGLLLAVITVNLIFGKD